MIVQLLLSKRQVYVGEISSDMTIVIMVTGAHMYLSLSGLKCIEPIRGKIPLQTSHWNDELNTNKVMYCLNIIFSLNKYTIMLFLKKYTRQLKMVHLDHNSHMHILNIPFLIFSPIAVMLGSTLLARLSNRFYSGWATHRGIVMLSCLGHLFQVKGNCNVTSNKDILNNIALPTEHPWVTWWKSLSRCDGQVSTYCCSYIQSALLICLPLLHYLSWWRSESYKYS